MRLFLSKYLIAVSVILFSSAFQGFSQSDFSISAGGGAMYYNGDLHDNSYLLPKEQLIKGFYNVDVNVVLVDKLSLSLGYLHGNIKGDDALSFDKSIQKRNLSFHSKIDEVSLVFRYKIFGYKSKEIINPFLSLGAGYFWFNPQAELDGKTYDLQPLGTEGQFIEDGDYPEPYKLSTVSMIFGAGAYFTINHNFGVRVEFAPRLTFTDYLDDVSNVYPDSTALAATPNGSTAVQLSSNYATHFPKEGKKRGNEDKNDVMMTFGGTLVYTFGSQRSGRGLRVGVLPKMFKGKKGWW